MAIGATGILTADATPAVARRTWPQWLVLGLAMLAVAVISVVLPDAPARGCCWARSGPSSPSAAPSC